MWNHYFIWVLMLFFLSKQKQFQRWPKTVREIWRNMLHVSYNIIGMLHLKKLWTTFFLNKNIPNKPYMHMLRIFLFKKKKTSLTLSFFDSPSLRPSFSSIFAFDDATSSNHYNREIGKLSYLTNIDKVRSLKIESVLVSMN